MYQVARSINQSIIPIDESNALMMAQSADEHPGSETMIACLNELIKATVITVLSLAVTVTLDENDFAVINGAAAWKICFDRDHARPCRLLDGFTLAQANAVHTAHGTPPA